MNKEIETKLLRTVQINTLQSHTGNLKDTKEKDFGSLQ